MQRIFYENKLAQDYRRRNVLIAHVAFLLPEPVRLKKGFGFTVADDPLAACPGFKFPFESHSIVCNPGRVSEKVVIDATQHLCPFDIAYFGVPGKKAFGPECEHVTVELTVAVVFPGRCF
jgi:hypothetical protein